MSTPPSASEASSRKASIFDEPAAPRADGVVTIIPAEFEDAHRYDIITKDPLWLVDLPIGSDAHVRQIEIVTIDKQGNRRKELRDGKVLRRRGPHPTYVVLNGQVVRRDEVRRPADVALAKPLMVNIYTTIIYHDGVVQWDHWDIQYAALHLLYDQYLKSAKADGRVVTTRPEIAKILRRTNNGHLKQDVEDALRTLAGLRVSKVYEEPSPGELGHGIAGTCTETVGGFITRSFIEKAAGGSGPEGGRRPDVIHIEFAPSVVRAMCGDTKDRMYVLNNLNLSANLRHGIHWQRQLERMLQARLKHRGRFQMPLVEMWVSCLGGDPADLDPERPTRWRKVRQKLRQLLTEWESTGFLQNVEFFSRPRHLDRLRVEGTEQQLSINVGDTEFTVTVPKETLDGAEWVSCECGPNFYDTLPRGREDFAEDILAVTVEKQEQRAKILEQLTAVTVIDIGHRRMKTLIQMLGDRHTRLPTTSWLEARFPQTTRVHHVNQVVDAYLHRLQASARGQQQLLPMMAAHAERRAAATFRILKSKLGDDPLAISELAERDEQPTQLPEAETLACFRLVLDRLIAERNVPREILSEEHRVLHELERDYRQLVVMATDLAMRAASQILWFDQVERRCATRLPPIGEDMPKELRLGMARQFRDAARMVDEMQSPDRSEWERYLAVIFQRRIAERMVEQAELDRIDPEGAVAARAPGAA